MRGQVCGGAANAMHTDFSGDPLQLCFDERVGNERPMVAPGVGLGADQTSRARRRGHSPAAKFAMLEVVSEVAGPFEAGPQPIDVDGLGHAAMHAHLAERGFHFRGAGIEYVFLQVEIFSAPPVTLDCRRIVGEFPVRDHPV